MVFSSASAPPVEKATRHAAVGLLWLELDDQYLPKLATLVQLQSLAAHGSVHEELNAGSVAGLVRPRSIKDFNSNRLGKRQSVDPA